MEAHVHVVFPQDPIADAGRHGRGAPVKAAAAAGARAVVWEGHGRAEELGELLRRALVHALQRHGEVEPVRKSNFGRLAWHVAGLAPGVRDALFEARGRDRARTAS